MSLKSYDLKRMIACSTLSNVTISLIGTGSEEYGYGYRHLINHGWVKGVTFMLVGVLIHETHNQDSRRNLVAFSPLSSSLLVVAA